MQIMTTIQALRSILVIRLILQAGRRAGRTRHRVTSAATPRMTAPQSFHTQPNSASRPVLRHRLDHVARARRLEAAPAPLTAKPDEKGRDRPLIQFHQRTNHQRGPRYRRNPKPDTHALAVHERSSATVKKPLFTAKPRHSSRRLPKSANAAPRRATITMCNPAANCGRCTRKISLKRRRARLRSTALPTLREVITPPRGKPPAGSIQPPNDKYFPPREIPSSRTRRNSARRCSLAGFGRESAAMQPPRIADRTIKRPCDGRSELPRPWATSACGRADDDAPRWRVRLWFSCGRGNRADVCACVWKLGTFFS